MSPPQSSARVVQQTALLHLVDVFQLALQHNEGHFRFRFDARDSVRRINTRVTLIMMASDPETVEPAMLAVRSSLHMSASDFRQLTLLLLGHMVHGTKVAFLPGHPVHRLFEDSVVQLLQVLRPRPQVRPVMTGTPEREEDITRLNDWKYKLMDLVDHTPEFLVDIGQGPVLTEDQIRLQSLVGFMIDMGMWFAEWFEEYLLGLRTGPVVDLRRWIAIVVLKGGELVRSVFNVHPHRHGEFFAFTKELLDNMNIRDPALQNALDSFQDSVSGLDQDMKENVFEQRQRVWGVWFVYGLPQQLLVHHSL